MLSAQKMIMKGYNMLFNSIGIKNYKSFDEEGIIIKDISKINLIIGKNNSGKSNILSFLKLLSEHSDNSRRIELKIEDQFRRNGKNLSIVVELRVGEIFDVYPQLSDHFKDDEIISIELDLKNHEIVSSFVDGIDHNHTLLKLQSQHSSTANSILKETINNTIKNILINEFNNFKDLMYIPHFRQITNKDSETDKRNISGDNIIPMLFKMQNPRLGEEQNKEAFLKIQDFVRDLVGVSDLKIEIPYDKQNIIVEMHDNRLPISSFGTGIHELVIMCSALAIYQNHIVCIEEPEIHLHPELQRKFLKFLNSTDNTYFITTHSNVFLDFNGASITHIVYDGHSSKVRSSGTSLKSNEILNDLAYKASDILQANCIIWVEGPSDRIYLKKWINEKAPELIEGLHYSIMFYGGRLLSHLTLENGEIDDFISINKLNRNSAIIIDSDKKYAQTPINETKKRIEKEFELMNCFCWITQGREIENYINKDGIHRAIKEVYGEDVAPAEWGKFNKLTTFTKSGKEKEINKILVAKRIIEHNTNFEVLDLDRKVTELVEFIKQANYMPRKSN